jgi:hypothetical protein
MFQACAVRAEEHCKPFPEKRDSKLNESPNENGFLRSSPASLIVMKFQVSILELPNEGGIHDGGYEGNAARNLIAQTYTIWTGRAGSGNAALSHVAGCVVSIPLAVQQGA